MAEEVVEPEQAQVPTYYDVEFAYYSLGTEEELIDGPAVVVTQTVPDVDPKLIAVLRDTGTNKVLVEITQDLPQPPAGHMVELRTTPTELSVVPQPDDDAEQETPADKPERAAATDWDNEVAWERRRLALRFAIFAVDSLQPLKHGDEWESIRIEVLNPHHRFVNPPGRREKTVQQTGRQATIGIPVAEIGANPALDLDDGQVHKYLKLPWYRQTFADNFLLSDDFQYADRVRYAIVLSATMKLAFLLETHNRRIGTGEAKDAWGVRPRTAPIALFDADEDLKTQVKMALLALDQWPGDDTQDRPPSPGNWALARGIVVRGQSLGGTTLPGCAVSGEQAALFEYRRPDLFPEQFARAFWVKPLPM